MEKYLGTVLPEHLTKASPYDVELFAERTGEHFSHQEWIPLRKIVVDDTPINDQHARDLGAKMLTGEFRMTQSVLLRCRIVSPENVVYDVLDGYHRREGLYVLTQEDPELYPNPHLKAEVMYNCSDEEMYDQRILAVNSVASVKFARIGFWKKLR